ncbi:allophanate hydrolase [Cupriavidus pauculus]|nr:allophanate hydrolase [Cupriavidus pauculus]
MERKANMPSSRLPAIATLLAQYANGSLTPTQCVDDVLARIEASDRPEAWIHRVDAEALHARAGELEARLASEGAALLTAMPLFGVPFAVKDNVDVAGLPTTAACPAFAYVPTETAFAVEQLLAAGAILIGKTNLDQFATGLVGTRSPYGAVRQIDQPDRVSGGSSSGSAVAVAAGCVAFSLGTDTAGSGRIPAGFNHLVGLKPTLGLVSKRGVVPACRSLDTLSIFAHDVADAWRVLAQIAVFDARDGYAREIPALGLPRGPLRMAVPDIAARAEGFDGDALAAQAFAQTMDAVRESLQIAPSTVPFAPLQEAALLLYDGPWVAERRAALGTFFDTHHDALDPTVAAVIGKADRYSATDAFEAQYRMADLRREAEAMFASIDVLVVPTAPTHPTIAALRDDPIGVNSQLGRYTNFVNLLDLCAIAVPGVRRADGLPAGITLIGPAGADQRIAVLGARIAALFAAPADGADAGAVIADLPLPFAEPTVAVAVVGAHLRGQPLNWQLREAGATLRASTRTAPRYRLYALAGTTPPKPGLARVADADHAHPGAAIEVEVWELPLRTFGKFVADIPAPLGIGNLELEDGSHVKGFICEPHALAEGAGARDITAFGGWRAYLSSL